MFDYNHESLQLRLFGLCAYDTELHARHRWLRGGPGVMHAPSQAGLPKPADGAMGLYHISDPAPG